MPRPNTLPTYNDDLAGFAGILRTTVFTSQRQAADYFHLNRSTVVRYENEDLKPSLGYLACLVRLVAEKRDRSETDRRHLLTQLNRAIQYHYQDVPFQTWPELAAVADAYLTERSQQVGVAHRSQVNQSPPSIAPTPPAETPALPVFYIERPVEQSQLRRQIREAHVPALVLWGAGGAGKSVLMAWLAANLADQFPDGQIWVELPEEVSPQAAVSEAQLHIAHSLGVVLPGGSLAERAGQLRTLLAGKRCLLMIDNVSFTSDLAYLQVTGPSGCLLITTRYRKVADVLESPLIPIKGMSPTEGLNLLVRWADYSAENGEGLSDLVHRSGGLPLALKLFGARLREGETVTQLRTSFAHDHIDLGQFDLDDPQTPHDGLLRCFERSLSHLTESDRQGFIQLGCFAGHFEVDASAAVWEIPLKDAHRRLRRLHSLALLKREGATYQLHPLLRDYARQNILTLPAGHQQPYQRHTAYYIRRRLYQPQILEDAAQSAPHLDQSWVDVVAAVRWAATYDRELAAIAALLAYGDRPALLEAVGGPLIQAVETYVNEAETIYRGMWFELLGDLYLLDEHYVAAVAAFTQADELAQAEQYHLSSSRAKLRLAGIHLILEDRQAALEMMNQAQMALAQGLPVTEAEQAALHRLFYWFNLVSYSMLRQWPDSLPEAHVQRLVELAQLTEQPSLEARAWHIYRLWCTVGEQPEPIRQQGRQFGVRAAWLWWRNGQKDNALAEVMWTQEHTRGRRSTRLARHFAQRRSRGTPVLSQNQIQLIRNEKLRHWLAADEAERIEWLVNEMPDPNTDDWQELDDLLALGVLGQGVRRLAKGSLPPAGWAAGQAMWRVLTGQKVLSLSDPTAIAGAKRGLERLEAVIKTSNQ
ncbi:MAG: hypothetical protein H6633_14680 [Anaerolineales bacterium]|nr:hypothetical protein [Anaerolineales bacterium]